MYIPAWNWLMSIVFSTLKSVLFKLYTTRPFRSTISIQTLPTNWLIRTLIKPLDGFGYTLNISGLLK